VAKIWGVDKGEVQGRFSWKILTPALNIAFSPDGSRIVTSDQQAPSYRIVLRDVSKGDEIRTLATHFQPPQTVAVSPDGKRALSGSDDWKVLLSDLETGKELLRLAGPTGAILNVIFTPDGRSALAICADRTIWQWNLKTGRDQQLADLREPAKFTPVAAALAPDGAAAAYCGADGALVLWDVKRGKELQRAPLSVAATRVVFSADSRLLATANANGTASVYRVGSAGE
jgi:WD40 repeat protein